MCNNYAKPVEYADSGIRAGDIVEISNDRYILLFNTFFTIFSLQIKREYDVTDDMLQNMKLIRHNWNEQRFKKMPLLIAYKSCEKDDKSPHNIIKEMKINLFGQPYCKKGSCMFLTYDIASGRVFIDYDITPRVPCTSKLTEYQVNELLKYEDIMSNKDLACIMSKFNIDDVGNILTI